MKRFGCLFVLAAFGAGCGRVDPNGFGPARIGARDAGDGGARDASAGDGATPQPEPEGRHRDLDGDGFSDLVLQAEQATVYVFFGGINGVSDRPNLTYRGAFAWPMSLSHDLNADGFSDLVIGGTDIILGAETLANNITDVHLDFCCALTTWRPPRSRFGAVLIGEPAYGPGFRVFRARAMTVDTQPSDRVDDIEQGGTQFDQVFATGDFDGDGFEEIALGAFGDLDFVGAIRVYDGDPPARVQLVPSPPGQGLFGGVLTAGDFNGDGRDDLAATANNGVDPQIFVFHGTPGTHLGPVERTLEAPDWSGYPGPALSAVGDVNGDGYGDLLVGAFYDARMGRAELYFGSADGLRAQRDRAIEISHNQFSFRVGAAGDLNGDRLADFVVTGQGAAFVYYGNTEGRFDAPDETLTPSDRLLFVAR